METPEIPPKRAKNRYRMAEEQSRTMPDTAEGEVLDRAAALDRVGGDEALLAEIADLFLHEYPTQLAAIKAAVAAGNASDLERAAHSLKGSVANFGAAGVVETALALEHIAREGQIDSAAEVVGVLEQWLDRLRSPLAELAAERKK